jgi:drug/metabolite transporter (DMT)-like permease
MISRLMDASGFALLLLGMVLNVGAQVALKKLMQPFAEVPLLSAELIRGVLTSPLLYVGLVLYAFSVVNWLIVLKRMDLGLAYPAMSFAYIATFLLGVWLFHEPLSTTRMVGIAVIMGGVFLISRPA